MTVGWLMVDRDPPQPRHMPVLFGAVAVVPDLDIFAGAHRMYAHSIGATIIVLLVARLALGPAHWRLAIALAAAWGSHVLLDWLGNDTSWPIGLMALWPFSDAYSQSPLHLFDAVSRRYWLPQEFIWDNLRAALKEVAILGPPAWAAFWLRGRRRVRA
jgi:hypothetical protein